MLRKMKRVGIAYKNIIKLYPIAFITARKPKPIHVYIFFFKLLFGYLFHLIGITLLKAVVFVVHPWSCYAFQTSGGSPTVLTKLLHCCQGNWLLLLSLSCSFSTSCIGQRHGAPEWSLVCACPFPLGNLLQIFFLNLITPKQHTLSKSAGPG